MFSARPSASITLLVWGMRVSTTLKCLRCLAVDLLTAKASSIRAGSRKMMAATDSGGAVAYMASSTAARRSATCRAMAPPEPPSPNTMLMVRMGMFI